ncbi:MAG: type II toxin-antitoxin system VapC family toxin [Burkholderiales bacterium]|nr:type II toxin-antitoxin system VapC family toxin [Burkholderiales bacterium]
MIYVDTSAWIALQLHEAKTEAVQAWVEARGMTGLACAEWVKTEYASALSIKRRRGDIDDNHFERAHRAFGKICVAGPTWLSVETPDFFEARACVPTPPPKCALATPCIWQWRCAANVPNFYPWTWCSMTTPNGLAWARSRYDYQKSSR